MTALYLLLVLAVIGCLEATNLRIPLRRVESKRENLIKSNKWSEYAQSQKKLFEHSRAYRMGGHDISIFDYSDAEYVGSIMLGTPPQEFSILPDTGSADLWVPDSSCGAGDEPTDECAEYCKGSGSAHDAICNWNLCPKKCCGTQLSGVMVSEDVCDSKNRYNSVLSSTHKKDGRPFAIHYGTGSCEGFVGRDTAAFAGFKIQNLFFGQATHLADFFASSKFDGIMGMAFPALSASGAMPVVNQLIDQHQIDDGVFGVYMKRTDKDGDDGGEVTIGYLDESHYIGDLNYVPLSRQLYWQFNLQSISIGKDNIDFGSAGSSAISDTGTSFIVGPSAVINRIAADMGAEFDAFNGVFRVACDSDLVKPLQFGINNDIYTVAVKDFMRNIDETQCYLALDGADGFPIDWILGDVFIRSVYQAYDITNGRIGMAQAKHDNF